VFLHFDELDSLSILKGDDQERMNQFCMFRQELLSYLKEKVFVFCSGRQAWFQNVGRRSPSFLCRIVLRALNKSHITDLISMSPAEDVVLRSEGKTVRDQLNLDDENLLMAVSEQIERITSGIPRLVDFSIHYLCEFSINQRISTEIIQNLFDKNSVFQTKLRDLEDVQIILNQLELDKKQPFFTLLVWLGYTEIAVSLSLTFNFFGFKKLSVSEIVDYCYMYLSTTDGSKVVIKLPQFIRDVIEDNTRSPFVTTFPLVKTGSQWKTLENLVHCFLWSLMKMSSHSSQKILLGDICNALKSTHAGKLHFDSDSSRNLVFTDIGPITKNTAKDRYSSMIESIKTGERAIVSFLEKSHGPDHLLIFKLNVLTLVGIQDKLYRRKNWASKNMLKEEIEKFALCCMYCAADRSVFVMLAPFLDGDLEEYDGQLLTCVNFDFIPVNMHVVILSLKKGAASFLFAETLVFELVES
jgi:hypothetical protein